MHQIQGRVGLWQIWQIWQRHTGNEKAQQQAMTRSHGRQGKHYMGRSREAARRTAEAPGSSSTTCPMNNLWCAADLHVLRVHHEV